ncbi:unnamed protein product [Prunus armeniaca]
MVELIFRPRYEHWLTVWSFPIARKFLYTPTGGGGTWRRVSKLSRLAFGPKMIPTSSRAQRYARISFWLPFYCPSDNAY